MSKITGETKIETSIIGGCGSGKCSMVKAFIDISVPIISSVPVVRDGSLKNLIQDIDNKIYKDLDFLKKEVDNLLPDESARTTKRKNNRKKKKRK